MSFPSNNLWLRILGVFLSAFVMLATPCEHKEDLETECATTTDSVAQVRATNARPAAAPVVVSALPESDVARSPHPAAARSTSIRSRMEPPPHQRGLNGLGRSMLS